jgi:hypothetical protein
VPSEGFRDAVFHADAKQSRRPWRKVSVAEEIVLGGGGRAFSCDSRQSFALSLTSNGTAGSR